VRQSEGNIIASRSTNKDNPLNNNCLPTVYVLVLLCPVMVVPMWLLTGKPGQVSDASRPGGLKLSQQGP
jgi:hypothetical protein